MNEKLPHLRPNLNTVQPSFVRGIKSCLRRASVVQNEAVPQSPDEMFWCYFTYFILRLFLQFFWWPNSSENPLLLLQQMQNPFLIVSQGFTTARNLVKSHYVVDSM